MEMDKTSTSAGKAKTFLLSDDLASATELARFRREVKFALSDSDYGKVQRILEVNCRRIIFNRIPSRVTSLYFDDHQLSACLESMDGVSTRSKTRLRWYDTGDDEGRLFFEIKRRVGDVIQKKRFAIESALPLRSMSLIDIGRELRRALPRQFEEILAARPEPVLIVSYEREHFRALDHPARITLDAKVTCYDQTGKSRLSTRFGVRFPGLVIVECKTPPDGEMSLPRLLHPLAPTVTKSSKYLMGCLKLGLLTGTTAGHY